MKMTEMYFFQKAFAENPVKIYIAIGVAVAAVIGSVVYEILKARKG